MSRAAEQNALYESLVQQVCGLSRDELRERLANFSGPMPLDFSPDYLDGCSVEQMRHLLVAAMWRSQLHLHGWA